MNYMSMSNNAAASALPPMTAVYAVNHTDYR